MIKKLAATTPFEVSALTESFVKLTAFGMQPTEAQMRSLSDVTANLGGGTEALSGITLALGQAWTKGKLQGQEIMQLAERGVPVWDALAKATGRNVPELTRMSEAGLLGRDVISKLIDELGRMNTGASDKLMNTYAGAVSNAKDALAKVSRSGLTVGGAGFSDAQDTKPAGRVERMKDTGELPRKSQSHCRRLYRCCQRRGAGRQGDCLPWARVAQAERNHGGYEDCVMESKPVCDGRSGCFIGGGRCDAGHRVSRHGRATRCGRRGWHARCGCVAAAAQSDGHRPGDRRDRAG